MIILIAEDQPDSRLVLLKTLESAGHRVISAVHGQDALEKAQATPPDLIISDILMPVMDGFKFCYAVKNEPRLQHIPFVFYTATYVDLEDEQLAMEMGATRYIVKPVEPIEFLKILDEIIAGMNQHPTNPTDGHTADKPGLLAKYDSRISKKLSKKVRELELYKNFYQNSSEPFCVLTTEGTILQANSAFCRFFDCLEQKLISRPAEKFFGTPCFNALTEAIGKHHPYNKEIEILKSDGQAAFLDISAAPLFDENSALTAIIVQLRDITLRRQHAANLELYHRLINQSNDSVFVIDAHTSKFRHVNRYACERLGYSKAELMQRGVMEISTYFTDLEQWHQHVNKMQQNPAFLMESNHITKSGESFPVEISVRYIEDSQGRYITAVARDISERKEAEKRDRQAQREWARTFDSSTDIITIQNLDFKIFQCNQATANVFQKPKKDLIGKQCYELFSGATEPCDGCPIAHVLEKFKPYSEIMVHKKLGKTFSVSTSPILNDTGEMTGIAHVAHDITEQKKLEGQLQQAQKMESLGTLAGGIAHDFNNILSAILGYAQLAKLHTPQGSKIEHDLEQIITGGKRASELVKQILTFSRKTEHRLEPVKIQEIVLEAAKLLRASIPATIEIKTDVESHCPPILSDASQIHQVIMNLCTNGYHAMREQNAGTLEISLQKREFLPGHMAPELRIPSGEYLQLTISDTGSGMNSATIEKIFDPYFTTKKKGDGSGLGLAVVHGIIRNIGGQISVYSELGQGSSFKIYLPIPTETGTSAPKKQIEEEVPMGNEHLLIVDDEEPIANLFKLMLQRYGYQVTNTCDGEEALKVFKLHPELFDLIITDYAMPKMNGFELAEEIVKIRPAIPIILSTGFNDISNKSKTSQKGIKSYINKPIQANQLAQIVRQTLDDVS